MKLLLRRIFIALVGLSGLIWLGYEAILRAHQLSFVPPAMQVTDILYAAEEAWGFGPGGNETGIIVYAMPENTRQRVETDGTDWLNGLAGSGSGWKGYYHNWHASPYDAKVPGAFDIWLAKARDETCGHGAGIAAYMFRYGFCIPIDHEVEALANRALSEPGNFYAFGRIGMLLVIPAENRIIYAYNG